MALEMDSWAVTGAQSSARIARLMHQSGTASGNGVVDVGHLQVLPLEVPGGGVRILAGGATILGKEQEFQGSYFAYNVGTDTVDIASTGSGGGRSDLVVLQVEDPNIDGTPWGHDVTTDPVYYFRVIEGVSSTATEAPSGTTAIPLARIDLPASTGTVTAAHITDLRQSANPRTERVLRTQFGEGLEDGRMDYADYKIDYERWPQHDWVVTIPEWATQVQVVANWVNVVYPAPSSTTGVDARGRVRVGLIGGGGNNLFTRHSFYNFNQQGVNNAYRCSIGLSNDVMIPESMRGRTCQLRMYAQATDVTNHYLLMDGWANAFVDLQFNEIPAPRSQL